MISRRCLFFGLLLTLFFSIPFWGEDQAPSPALQSQDQLIQDLKSQDPDLRRRAIDGLTERGYRPAVGSFIKLLRDKNKYVRKSAAFALGQMGGGHAVEPLIEAVKRDEASRAIAVRSLGQLGDERAVEPLEEALLDKNPLVVAEAANALRSFNAASILPSLISAVKTADAYGCQAIVSVLGKLRSPKAVDVLLIIIEDKERFACAANAVEALSYIGGNRAEDSLIGLLTRPSASDFMKSVLLKSLGRLKSQRAYESVVPFLNHKKSAVRSAAIESLVGIGNKKAIPFFEKGLDDPSAAVREVSKYALGQFGVKVKK